MIQNTIKRKIFVEGSFDKAAIRKLNSRKGINGFEIVDCGGKNKMEKKIREDLEPDLVESGKQLPIHVLIIVDKDGGETEERICQRFSRIFQQLLAEKRIRNIPITFEAHPSSLNIFIYETLPFKIVIHIAEKCDIPGFSFTNAQLEDYLLKVAGTDSVLVRFAEKTGIKPEDFRKKAFEEIPGILQRNGITVEQKDLILCYMTASRFLQLKKSDDEKLFITILMDRAEDSDISNIFSSYFRAIDFIRS